MTKVTKLSGLLVGASVALAGRVFRSLQQCRSAFLIWLQAHRWKVFLRVPRCVVQMTVQLVRVLLAQRKVGTALALVQANAFSVALAGVRTLLGGVNSAQSPLVFRRSRKWTKWLLLVRQTQQVLAPLAGPARHKRASVGVVSPVVVTRRFPKLTILYRKLVGSGVLVRALPTAREPLLIDILRTLSIGRAGALAAAEVVRV